MHTHKISGGWRYILLRSLTCKFVELRSRIDSEDFCCRLMCDTDIGPFIFEHYKVSEIQQSVRPGLCSKF